MSNLNITLIQTNLQWEDGVANRKKIQAEIEKIKDTDLILLPEMFASGFTMNTNEIAEGMKGESVDWMRQMAKKNNAVLCGSLIIEEEGNYYNRLIWMQPDGIVHHYDKRHLFRMAEEDHFFSAGENKLIVDLKGWKVCPLICYDLRFPVWSRNEYEKDDSSHQLKPAYDLLIYVANWPEARIKVWEKLLLARAIENQTYVAAVNRIGIDDNGINYSGNSMLIDPKGGIILKAKDHQEEVKTISIDLNELNVFREKFPVGMDADEFEIIT